MVHIHAAQRLWLTEAMRWSTIWLAASACGSGAAHVPPSHVPTMTTYPAPDGAPLSSLWIVRVTQLGSSATAPVYSSTSADRCTQVHQPPSSSWCPHDHTQSWASVWFSGAPITVTVTTTHPQGWGGPVAVRPRSAGITTTLVNMSTVSFVVPEAALGWKLSVESPMQMASGSSPGQPVIIQHSLMIFADPETLSPDPGNAPSDGKLYFGPGVHDLGGQMPLPPNVTSVYIAGGAWVKGGFISTESDGMPLSASTSTIHISGRGVLSASDEPFLVDPAGMRCFYNGSYCWAMVNLDVGVAHRVEGIVMHDPPKYYFRTYAADVVVHGVKMVGAWPYNTDGVVTGSGGVVSDTFIRSNDDSIKLFSNSMNVRDVIVWQMTNGAVFQMGWWSQHNQKNITIANVTILHAGWSRDPAWSNYHATNNGVFDLRGPDDNSAGEYAIKDIHWTNIVADSAIVGGGLVRFNLSHAKGAVTGLSFDGIHLPGAMDSSVALSPSYEFSGWVFTNLIVNGTCVTSAVDAGFVSAPNDIEFKCN